MKRVPTRELLDDDAGSAIEIAASLADIDALNRWFGGVSTTTRLVERISAASRRQQLSLLDVAAGSGQVTRSARARLAQRGIQLRLTLLDRCASHLLRHADEDHVVGDALALPFPDASFDVTGCCLFAHHLSPEEIPPFVQEALRCSRVAVFINDLVRHPLHFAAACAGRLVYRSRLTRFDAPASVRQAYTPGELLALVGPHAAHSAEVTRHYFYRMGVILWKDPAIRNGFARHA